MPDRYTCPLLWSGLLFISVWRRTSCMMPSGGDNGYLFGCDWLYRGIRGYEGLGYGDIKYLAALGAGMAGDCCRSWSRCLATRRHSVGRSRFIRQLRQEEQRSNPLPFGPFPAAAGFWCGWQTLASLTL
ncbi:prepilin peptidase [Klebsiella pneumoniae]|uniref:prepilin peptidase n=1 Tax=Klebsiella pneumoniae TaxID=573 RepID=UPI001E52309B|nr:A24 family peptidase [Klebsiella pneumoniae]